MSNILFIIDNFHTGGVTSFVKMYANILQFKDNKIFILGFESNLTNLHNFFPHTTIILIPKKIGFGLFNRVIAFFSYFYHYHLTLQKYRIDCLHFSTTWSALYCLLHVKTWKIKRIITFYGAYHLEAISYEGFRFSVKERVKYELRRRLQKIGLHHADIIITFSAYARELILRDFSEEYYKKIVLIPGLASQAYLHPPINTTKKIVLLSIGRAEDRKGLDILLDACKILQDKGVDYHLTIASPIEYYLWGTLLKKYEENHLLFNVTFLHSVNEKEKEILFTSHDLFVMPSRDLETFGLTIIESLSHGLPVIGTPTGAIPEILSKIDKNLISPTLKPTDLADTIIRYKKMKQKGKLQEKILRHINAEYNINRYTQLIQDLHQRVKAENR